MTYPTLGIDIAKLKFDACLIDPDNLFASQAVSQHGGRL